MVKKDKKQLGIWVDRETYEVFKKALLTGPLRLNTTQDYDNHMREVIIKAVSDDRLNLAECEKLPWLKSRMKESL